MSKAPELTDNFTDRGMNYSCIAVGQWAALYKVESDEDEDFICFDVFRLGNLKPVMASPDILYPDDDAFIFDKEVDSYSGEKVMEKDIFHEAVLRFKFLAYLM